MKPQAATGRSDSASPWDNDALPAVSADVTSWRSTEYYQNHSKGSNVTRAAGRFLRRLHACRTGPAVDQILAILIPTDLPESRISGFARTLRPFGLHRQVIG
jgi:hypothetical protein